MAVTIKCCNQSRPLGVVNNNQLSQWNDNISGVMTYTPWDYRTKFGFRRVKSSWASWWRKPYDPKVISFYSIPACDRQMDAHTHYYYVLWCIAMLMLHVKLWFTFMSLLISIIACIRTSSKAYCQLVNKHVQVLHQLL